MCPGAGGVVTPEFARFEQAQRPSQLGPFERLVGIPFFIGGDLNLAIGLEQFDETMHERTAHPTFIDRFGFGIGIKNQAAADTFGLGKAREPMNGIAVYGKEIVEVGVAIESTGEAFELRACVLEGDKTAFGVLSRVTDRMPSDSASDFNIEWRIQIGAGSNPRLKFRGVARWYDGFDFEFADLVRHGLDLARSAVTAMGVSSTILISLAWRPKSMESGNDRILIMIVDADATSRAATREAIEHAVPAATVVDTPTAIEALAKLEKLRFDLVISDYELPNKQGTFLDEIGRLIPERKPYGVVVAFGRVNEVPKVGKTHFIEKANLPARIADVAKEIFQAKLAQQTWTEGSAKPTAVQNVPSAAQATSAPAVVPAGAAIAPPSPAKKVPLDVNFINPFVEGTVAVLESTCSTKTERESVFMRKTDAISGDLSAVVALTTDDRQGTLTISFEKKCLLGIATRMIGEPQVEVNDEIKLVAGEICGQIFAYSRRKLATQGYDLKAAIPSVIYGADHQIRHVVKGFVVAARFRTPEGCFVLEAALAK